MKENIRKQAISCCIQKLNWLRCLFLTLPGQIIFKTPLPLLYLRPFILRGLPIHVIHYIFQQLKMINPTANVSLMASRAKATSTKIDIHLCLLGMNSYQHSTAKGQSQRKYGFVFSDWSEHRIFYIYAYSGKWKDFLCSRFPGIFWNRNFFFARSFT